jgi:hypothetical protein
LNTDGMPPGAEALSKALTVAQPASALRRLVLHRLSAEGQSRECVLGDLDDLRIDLANAGQLEGEETVMTVMDQMVGWCRPHLSLANVGESEFSTDAAA